MTSALSNSPTALPEARPHIFPELAKDAQKKPPLFSWETLADLPFTLDAPLGALEIDVRGLLNLRIGSVLQLDRLTGEPLEIAVNGTPIARGEVRIQGERFAIRVTEILRSEAREETGGNLEREASPHDGNAARRSDAVDPRARMGR